MRGLREGRKRARHTLLRLKVEDEDEDEEAVGNGKVVPLVNVKMM